MSANIVYLDANATCPVLPGAQVALAEALATGGNASSIHGAGRAARARVEAARGAVAQLVNAPASAVVFTSGASEANVLALRGLPAARAFVSGIEHDSVLNARADARALPVTGSGVLDLDALSAAARAGDLVCVMAVNNETGVIQPLAEIAGRVRAAGARLHVDAVQAPGRIAIDFRALALAGLSLSAHKFGGPPGVGALVVDEALPLAAQTRGGGQERGRRGGTENMPAIAGFGAAADWAAARRQEEAARQAVLRDRLEAALQDSVPDLRVIGAETPRVGNTSCLALPGAAAEKQVIALDLAGYAISAGSACSSGKVKASHVLQAMGLPDEIAGCAIRVSLSWATTTEEIDGFIEAYRRMAERLQPAPAAELRR